MSASSAYLFQLLEASLGIEVNRILGVLALANQMPVTTSLLDNVQRVARGSREISSLDIGRTRLNLCLTV